MKAPKCWKKDKAGWHPERLDGGSISGWVYFYPKKGFRGKEDQVVISTSSTGGSNPKDRKDTGFKTEAEALKYAHSYMKKHDKC